MRLRPVRAAALALVLALGVGACREEPAPRPPGTLAGEPGAGAEAIREYGCGGCHTIPGIEGADTLVGPPLQAWSQRSFIAGYLPNDADNLVAWLQDPEAFRPGTAMPDLDVTDADARDIAAYLLDLG